MPNDLLPCPFCGGEAHIMQIGTRRQSCRVSCEDCGCDHESGDEGDECGASWNQRAAPPRLPAPELKAGQCYVAWVETKQGWKPDRIVEIDQWVLDNCFTPYSKLSKCQWQYLGPLEGE